MASHPTAGTWSPPRPRARGAWVLEQLTPAVEGAAGMLGSGLVAEAQHRRARAEALSDEERRREQQLADLESGRRQEAAMAGLAPQPFEPAEALQQRIGGEMSRRRELAELNEARRLASALRVRVGPDVAGAGIGAGAGAAAGPGAAAGALSGLEVGGPEAAQRAAVHAGGLDPRTAPWVRVETADPLKAETMRAEIELRRAQAARARRPAQAPIDTRWEQIRGQIARAAQAVVTAELGNRRNAIMGYGRGLPAEEQAAFFAWVTSGGLESGVPPPVSLDTQAGAAIAEAIEQPLPRMPADEEITAATNLAWRQRGAPPRAPRPNPADFDRVEDFQAALDAWQAGAR